MSDQGTLSNSAAGSMLLWLWPFPLGDFVEVLGAVGAVDGVLRGRARMRHKVPATHRRARRYRGMPDTALVTGFEPYGGRALNPSGRLALALDGARVGGFQIVGRTLPVVLAGLGERLEGYLEEARPALAIALGLWPGEPMLRLERLAVNLADFTIADNAGARLEDAAIAPEGVTALFATLPLRAIENALLADGIPARLSTTAGTYLCNATLYSLLSLIERRGRRIPCGFIHVPYLPEQVAELLRQVRAGRVDLHQRADIASMDFAVMERGLRLALAVAGQSSVR